MARSRNRTGRPRRRGAACRGGTCVAFWVERELVPAPARGLDHGVDAALAVERWQSFEHCRTMATSGWPYANGRRLSGDTRLTATRADAAHRRSNRQASRSYQLRSFTLDQPTRVPSRQVEVRSLRAIPSSRPSVICSTSDTDGSTSGLRCRGPRRHARVVRDGHGAPATAGREGPHRFVVFDVPVLLRRDGGKRFDPCKADIVPSNRPAVSSPSRTVPSHRFGSRSARRRRPASKASPRNQSRFSPRRLRISRTHPGW